MIRLPPGMRIWIATGFTDMRCGFNGLAAIVEDALQDKPCSDHVFVFPSRRGNVIKLIWSSRDGLCIFIKQLEHGRFVWPQAVDSEVRLIPEQLFMLLEGIK